MRYDDRGVNESSGDFYQSTTEDFSKDVISGFEYLCSRKDIDPNRIGLVGHSEGGVVAAITASKNKYISFIVLLGSPGIKLKDDFMLQQESMYKSGDINKEQYKFYMLFNELCYQFIENGFNATKAKDSLSIFKEEFTHLFYSQDDDLRNFYLDNDFDILVHKSLSPHNQFNIKSDPSDYLEKVKCPVLSLNGSNDILVPVKKNQDAIRKALIKAENNNYKIIEIEGLNHSFQECKTGSIKEFFEIEQTFSPIALEEIGNWIINLNKKQ